jgi:uncharacterized protein YecA (UPF0149 family)
MTPVPDYSPDPTLTPQQHRIITLLAAGNSITQAAALENLHRNTIANWRRTVPAFARELEFAQREQRQYWHEQATRLAPLAIRAIEETLTNPNASPSLRFRAATLILKLLTDPQTKPTKGFPPLSPETEALQGELLQMHKDSQMHKAAQSAQQPEELASFRPPESAVSAAEKPAQICTKPQRSRNSQCPCNSGLKYKRCCLSKAA